MVKYTALNKKHTVEFYDENGAKVHVSVDNNVVKKNSWIFDLMELSEKELIDLKQFELLQMDNSSMMKSYDASRTKRGPSTVSPYWICGYCRSYVKHSGAALKRLCRQLNIKGMRFSPSVLSNQSSLFNSFLINWPQRLRRRSSTKLTPIFVRTATETVSSAIDGVCCYICLYSLPIMICCNYLGNCYGNLYLSTSSMSWSGR